MIFKDGFDDGPRRFHRILANEESAIADHRIAKKTFIGRFGSLLFIDKE